MAKNNEEFEKLILNENFTCTADCTQYFLNEFGKLDVAYSAGRIKKTTYRKQYKFLEKNMFANLVLLNKKSKEQLQIGRKELEKQVKSYKASNKPALISKNQVLLEEPKQVIVEEIDNTSQKN